LEHQYMKRRNNSWAEFHRHLIAHMGEARAQTNFCEHSNYTLSSVQHWRKTDWVPNAAFDALYAINPETCPPTIFRGYHSPEFTHRVIEMSKQKQTLSRIAHALSSEFGRTVTENMVKGIRFRNKDKLSSA